MTFDEFMNVVLPWVFGIFIVVWIVVVLVKILQDTWKD